MRYYFGHESAINVPSHNNKLNFVFRINYWIQYQNRKYWNKPNSMRRPQNPPSTPIKAQPETVTFKLFIKMAARSKVGALDMARTIERGKSFPQKLYYFYELYGANSPSIIPLDPVQHSKVLEKFQCLYRLVCSGDSQENALAVLLPNCDVGSPEKLTENMCYEKITARDEL